MWNACSSLLSEILWKRCVEVSRSIYQGSATSTRPEQSASNVTSQHSSIDEGNDDDEYDQNKGDIWKEDQDDYGDHEDVDESNEGYGRGVIPIMMHSIRIREVIVLFTELASMGLDFHGVV